MRADDLARVIVEEHERLEERLVALEELARAVARSAGPAGELRREAAALLACLSQHIDWEDLHLRPLLLETEAWGRERADALERDHCEQRELFAFALERVETARHPTRIVTVTLLDLIALLRADMRREEELLLDPHSGRDGALPPPREPGAG